MAPTQASGLNPMTGEATNIQPAPAAPQTAMQPQMAAQPIQSAQPIQPAQQPAQQPPIQQPTSQQPSPGAA